MCNFFCDELFHTFIDDTSYFCEVNTTIEELFKTDLGSATDSTGADFKSFFILTKFKYFVNTSKTYTSNELLCTIIRVELSAEDRFVALSENFNFGKLHVTFSYFAWENFIESLLNETEDGVFVLTISGIGTAKLIEFFTKSLIKSFIAKVLSIKTIRSGSRSICLSSSLHKLK
jgi:hypothetical protein